MAFSGGFAVVEPNNYSKKTIKTYRIETLQVIGLQLVDRFVSSLLENTTPSTQAQRVRKHILLNSLGHSQSLLNPCCVNLHTSRMFLLSQESMKHVCWFQFHSEIVIKSIGIPNAQHIKKEPSCCFWFTIVILDVLARVSSR